MADHLLSEIDQALRADRALKFWEANRGRVLGVALLVVATVAIHSAWQYYREVTGGEVMVSLVQSQELLLSGKASEAAKGFAVIADKSSGEMQQIARIWQARALIAAKDEKAAQQAFTQAVQGEKNLWSDLACLRLAGLGDAPCLTEASDTPLAATRAEWTAAQLWAKGDHAKAIATVKAVIEAKDTSEAVRARLTQWMNSMQTNHKQS